MCDTGKPRSGTVTNSCAYCGNPYQASVDPDWFDPWCSMECQNKSVGRA